MRSNQADSAGWLAASSARNASAAPARVAASIMAEPIATSPLVIPA